MQKIKKPNGTIQFDLSPDAKSKNFHDDRADCVAMLCSYLMELRAKDKMSSYTQEKKDYSSLLTQKMKTSHNNNNRFGGINPFQNMGSNPFLN